MHYTPPLKEGQLLKRYKRFFADIKISNEVIIAHVANSGSLKGCLVEKAPCLYSTNNDPNRKLKYTLEAIFSESSWVGVNTGAANRIVEEAWRLRKSEHWKEFDNLAREVKISDATRLDFVLWKGHPQWAKITRPNENLIQTRQIPFHFVEVKNVSMKKGVSALFPDSVTERGQKHLRELMQLIEQGHSCELVFTVQRTDVSSFSTADEIDPEYGRLLRQAIKRGLKVTPVVCEMSPSQLIWTNRFLPLRLD